MERRVGHDVTRECIDFHTRKMREMSPALLHTRSFVRTKLLGGNSKIDVGAIFNCKSTIQTGLVDEEEIENSLRLRLDVLPPVCRGEMNSHSMITTRNRLYKQALSLIEYKLMSAHSMRDFPSLLDTFDINIFDTENIKMLSRLMSHSKKSEVFEFHYLDLPYLALKQNETPESALTFNATFLPSLAIVGNTEKVFMYVTQQPSVYRKKHLLPALAACAEGGMKEKVLDLVEREDYSGTQDYPHILKRCLEAKTKQRVLALAKQYVHKNGLEGISEVLAECAMLDNKTAEEVHTLIQPYKRTGRAYDQALYGCISCGFSWEVLDRAMSAPTFYTNKNVARAVQVERSLTARALEFVSSAMNEKEKSEYLPILKICAENGYQKEVLALLHRFPDSGSLYIDVLIACFLKGSPEEVRQYITQHIPLPSDKSEEVLKNQKQTLTRYLAYNIKHAGIRKKEVHILLANLRSTIDSLTSSELLFFQLVVIKYGLLHPTTVDFLSERASHAEIYKTGSTLTLFNRQLTGVFMHDLDESSAQVWQELAKETDDPVPVEPILRFGKENKGIRTVMSRYCGPSIFSLVTNQGLVMTEDHKMGYLRPIHDIDFLYSFRDPMIRDITDQVFTILDKLQLKRIQHGHPHLGNFTYELIDRDYLSNYLHTQDSGKAKPTINNIPYSKDMFSFDFMKYNEVDEHGNKKWHVVVRLIDFDRTKSNNAMMIF